MQPSSSATTSCASKSAQLSLSVTTISEEVIQYVPYRLVDVTDSEKDIADTMFVQEAEHLDGKQHMEEMRLEIIEEAEEEGEEEEEREQGGREWEDIEWNAADGTDRGSRKDRVFKRSFYVGRSTVGTARKARKEAGLMDKFPLSDPLLQEFQGFLKSASVASSNITNIVSDI